MERDNSKFPGRRRFIRNVILTGSGAYLAPSLISCGGIKKIGSEVADDVGNLLYNGDFRISDPDNPRIPAGWQTGPGDSGQAVSLSDKTVQPGSRSVLQQRIRSDEYHYFMKQGVDLEPGALYRLRFHVRADEKSKDMFAVCISAKGQEGPAWLYRPTELETGPEWQLVDFVFRAQSGFNPLHFAEIEFRLHQWRPHTSFRPDRPRYRDVKQELYIGAVNLVKIDNGTRVPGRISRWLLVPGHDHLRSASVELGMGDGISMNGDSVELNLNGKKMTRVPFLEDIRSKDHFAYSERSKRLFVLSDSISPTLGFSYEVVKDNNGDALLGISSLTGRALRDGIREITRVPLHFESKQVAREKWPVTQGLPFGPGLLADLSSIRVLNSAGREIPAQVKATSYWPDDSVRWAMFDFNLEAAPGEQVVYQVEFGPGIRRKEVKSAIKITDQGNALLVENGKLRFKVSRERFLLFDELEVNGRRAMNGPSEMTVTEEGKKVFSMDKEAPFSVVVEESGPLRSVVAVHGWNGNGRNERFLTYTVRYHIYDNQPFVKVFHSLTNRHEEQVIGRHYNAPGGRGGGWPEDASELDYHEFPQRNISDASLLIKPAGLHEWVFITENGAIKGNVSDGKFIHRQNHHKEGDLISPSVTATTTVVPGMVGAKGKECAITVGIYRYSNLFPKATRVSSEGISLGLIPFSNDEPHGLLKGTARTVELFFSFDSPESEEGIGKASCFIDRTIFTNEKWYCENLGFMADALIPVNENTIGTYDRVMNSYVDNSMEPYPPGVDDCGMMNFGDYTYGGYNVWNNLEYDGDLGLYIHFARSGDRRAFIRGMDASRHFLDSDTGWYTGDFDTHGGNYQHFAAHYWPRMPAGHTYTLGLIHYYFLTGDRRALEATRYVADCVLRTRYHFTRVNASLFSEDDPVGPKRGLRVPGGPGRSINSRDSSDTSRYALHSYVATGEPRFLEASLAIAESLVLRLPEVWMTDDDQYMHYRWPQVIGRLYDMTGEKHFRDILVKCGEWMMDVPYARYGEFRVSQGYGSGPQLSGINNTRMMFLTAWAWKITGERRYLDWLINMFDFLIERDRHRKINRTSGKDLGKEGDNPARGAAWAVPHRTVYLDHSPSRFQIVPPGEDVWKLEVGNTSDTALKGLLTIGPLPEGIEMETSREFQLALGQEMKMEFPVKFTNKVNCYRNIIPFNISTIGADGRKGERNSFFAVHTMFDRKVEVPELLFHATLGDTKPAYSYGGDGKGIFEVEDFIPGRNGKKAIGPNSEGWAFDISGSILPDEGTFSIWTYPTGRSQQSDNSAFKIRGQGWHFLALNTRSIVACNQSFDFDFRRHAGKWLHVAIRWDRKRLTYFIDGEKVYDKKRINMEIPSGEVWGFPQNSAAYQDFKIFSVPLSDDRIMELAKS